MGQEERMTSYEMSATAHMNANAETVMSVKRNAGRVTAIDWAHVERDLDAQGNANIGQLLSPSECHALAGLYQRDDIFRSHVVMARHGFGRGEYKYFDHPLPELVE